MATVDNLTMKTTDKGTDMRLNYIRHNGQLKKVVKLWADRSSEVALLEDATLVTLPQGTVTA